MMKRMGWMAVVAVVALIALGAVTTAPAWALEINDHSNHSTNTQVNTQTTVNTNTNVNTNVQSQGQQQGQAQQQGQIQGQGQKQQANNEGNHQSTKIEAQMPVGIAIAPGLTAAGTGVCLGSVSIGLSGPFAGASFGITKVDKGCEQRSSAALLYQMGYKDAAVRLLMKNDDVREALGTDAPKTAAVIAPVSVSRVEPSIPQAMAATQTAAATSVQGQ